jgi:hypothetical protein
MAEVSHTPWLTPVIPATWEAKIGRIMDQGQLSQKKKRLQEPISMEKSWAWW